jgi:hypothetical protein
VGSSETRKLPRGVKPQTARETPKTALGNHHKPPPEPGLARREANYPQQTPSHLSRLLKPLHNATARKEGAHGETRGFPVSVERHVRHKSSSSPPDSGGGLDRRRVFVSP